MMIRLMLLFVMAVLPVLASVPDKPNKTVLVAILARNKAHVLPRFLKCIENLDYDKKLVTLYINTNNNKDDTAKILQQWAKQNESKYQRIVFENHEVAEVLPTSPHEWTPRRFKILGEIRNKSMKKAQEYNTDYYFVVDCDNFIIAPTLSHLVSKDKPIIAPMLRTVPIKEEYYSNFFAAVDAAGYYKVADEYYPILDRSKIGTFKVPVVHCTYLINTKYIDKLNYIDDTDDHEFVIFSRYARKNNVDQYICNEKPFGVLLHFVDNLTLEEEAKQMEQIQFPEGL